MNNFKINNIKPLLINHKLLKNINLRNNYNTNTTITMKNFMKLQIFITIIKIKINNNNTFSQIFIIIIYNRWDEINNNNHNNKIIKTSYKIFIKMKIHKINKIFRIRLFKEIITMKMKIITNQKKIKFNQDKPLHNKII